MQMKIELIFPYLAKADKDFKDVSFADAPLKTKKTYLKSGRSAVGRKV